MENYRAMLKRRLGRLVNLRNDYAEDLSDEGRWLLDRCIRATAEDLDALPKVSA